MPVPESQNIVKREPGGPFRAPHCSPKSGTIPLHVANESAFNRAHTVLSSSALADKSIKRHFVPEYEVDFLRIGTELDNKWRPSVSGRHLFRARQ